MEPRPDRTRDDRRPQDQVIRTPDQRLRVFVSSTLTELAEERQAVARAVSALRLTPVVFEAGARPHPPRDLYRAYLAQSDVFIGLYWQRYGWVGPGMQMSGLQEEFELSSGLPRLLYVKAPAPEREPRLAELLARVEAEAATSYRSFHTARELGRLVRDDLATLLSERFGHDGRANVRPETDTPPRPSPAQRSLPAPMTSLIGRERTVEAVAELLTDHHVRLVTLTGLGGIGKTRLALAVAERLRDRFDAGTTFVPLARETEPRQVVLGIGRAVGADLAESTAPLDALVERLGDDRWLLVLDNLEQVVDVAVDVGEVLARCPHVVILATSRTPLRLQAEREYPVPALPVPDDAGAMPLEELAAVPAVALFVDRARAVHPEFALTDGNAQAVVGICRLLEGLPLAIELAAARIRLLDPASLLARLSRSLEALGTGPVDLPERQQTLRATVEWSLSLLADDERSFVETMTVFMDGWTLDAAAHVAQLDEDRAFDLLEGLTRHSLVRLDGTDHGPRCRMLETIRVFVAERLAARPDAGEVRRRHAEYYRDLAERADRPLRSTGQGEWGERLRTERGNLAAAVEWYVAHETTLVPHLFRVLWPFRLLLPLWGVRDCLAEARASVDRFLPTADALGPEARVELFWTAAMTAVEVGDESAARAACERLAPLVGEVDDPYLQAVSHLAMAWVWAVADDTDRALPEASLSVQGLDGRDEPLWSTIATLTLGALEMATGRYEDALRHLTVARDQASTFDDALLAAVTRVWLGDLAVQQGRPADAWVLLTEGLDLSLAAHSTHCLCLCLAGFAHLALAEGDAERAALLAGSVDGLRRRTGLSAWASLRRDEAAIADRVRQALGASRFDDVFSAGSRLSQREAVGTARNRQAPEHDHPVT